MPPLAGVIDEVDRRVITNRLVDLSTLVLCDLPLRDSARAKYNDPSVGEPYRQDGKAKSDHGEEVLNFGRLRLDMGGGHVSHAGRRLALRSQSKVQREGYDLARSLAEAETARANRQAEVCVFVHSTRTAPPSIPTFQRYGRDLVVRWNADDDANDVWLEAALMVATALSVKAASHDKQDAASFEKIDKAVERVRKALEGFDEVNTSANTIKSAAEKILNRARLMQEGLSSQVQSIVDEIAKIEAAAAKE